LFVICKVWKPNVETHHAGCTSRPKRRYTPRGGTELMRVEVKVVCAPHPVEEIEDHLRAAGRQLASRADSVSVQVHPPESRTAVLEFEMRQAAQYKAVAEIYEAVKFWAWAFYEDVTIRFPKGES
jgi:hypothetical protein